MTTVKDIMITDVINISPEATVRDLAQVLSEAQISGVPVVDSKRELVGVVSATDVVRFASEQPSTEEAPGPPATDDEALPDYVPSFFLDAGSLSRKLDAHRSGSQSGVVR